MRLIFYSQQMPTPNVLGLHLNDAIKKLSSYHLNVRIIKEKEDNDLPAGTIISQSPEPARNIRPYQSVFLIITRKQPPITVPKFINLILPQAQKLADSKNIQLRKYYIESSYPSDTIIAQMPQVDQKAENDIVTVYVSSGSTSIRIFPDLRKKTISQAKGFLKEYGLAYKINHANTEKNDAQIEQDHDCSGCIIEDQRPQPGDLVDLKKGLTVQLTVK